MHLIQLLQNQGCNESLTIRHPAGWAKNSFPPIRTTLKGTTSQVINLELDFMTTGDAVSRHSKSLPRCMWDLVFIRPDGQHYVL